ncbi:MAG: tRNA (adenosine(37)-N6)-threonylcarbamoyltransferase complex dimerization subunit type 1 TsaB [Planctomycetes bacterium]|nr:tRNA (adenosine(37)-N6)-threonylcarbamoyltransferase complex dimerization subunit type 1 TsaB [Planctomycetota bacterium]NBY02462.1 tRNA (adenosine(37)-N6)-threonylcarbamoyltransferase complex dimerization subunit type 1 TsaB [Planctomycetota bacterium]
MGILPEIKAVPSLASEAKILLLETSGVTGIVALGSGSTVVSHRVLEIAKRHVSDMAPAIANMLKELDWEVKNLDAIATGIGPGSYTGLRIGMMSARTLAMITGARLLGISTFEIMARHCMETGHAKIEIIADAQKDKIYTQRFENNNNHLNTIGELEIVSTAEWISSRDMSFTVAGPGIPKVLPLITGNQILISRHSGNIDNQSFLALALKKLMSHHSDDPLSLQPLYLRRSSAEEQWDKRIHDKAINESENR